MSGPEQVTKLEVAERQLVEAIMLFFQRRDRVAIHALASGAHQVLSDLAIAHGKATIIKNNPRLNPDPEIRSEYYRRLNEAYNFMKHADRDPDPGASVTFRPAVIPHILFDSVLIYVEFNRSIPSEFRAFLVWYQVKFSDVLLDGEFKDFVTQQIQDGLDADDYEVFLQLIPMLPRAEYPK